MTKLAKTGHVRFQNLSRLLSVRSVMPKLWECPLRIQLLSKSSFIANTSLPAWRHCPVRIVGTLMNLAISHNHFRIHSNTKMATTRATEQYCSNFPKSTL